MTLAELLVNLRMNATDFLSGVSAATQRWQELSRNMIEGGAVLSGAVTLPFALIGKQAFSLASELQAAEIGFTTMLQSGERAGVFLEDLKDFAAKTPFEFPDLVRSSRRLMALGFAAEEVIPMMRSLGNAAAGLGGSAELIDRLSLALGQMRAKGKVSAEEMRQLAEAGIPAWEMLAKAIGVSIPAAMEMAQKGAISAAKAVPVIVAGMNDRFAGLMENFSKTVPGQLSNLKDSIGFILADIGKALMPLVSIIMEQIAIPAVDTLRELVASFAALPMPVQAATVAVTGLAAAIGPALITLGGLGRSVEALKSLTPVIGAVTGSFNGLFATFGSIGTAITSGMLPALTAGELALGIFSGAVLAVGAAWALWQIDPVREALTDFWHSTLEPFTASVVEMGRAFVASAASMASSALGSVWESLRSIGTALMQVWDSLVVLAEALWRAFRPLVTAAVDVASAMSKITVSALLKALEVLVQLVGGALVIAFRLAAGAVNVVAGAVVLLSDIMTQVLDVLADLIKWVGDLEPAFKVAGVAILAVATGALPAAITALTTFATVTIPAAVTALYTFATATIPAAISAVANMAALIMAALVNVTFPALVAAVGKAVTALGTMYLTALPLLAHAAGVAAAAFVGWKLGEWIRENIIDAIPWVSKLADTIIGPLSDAIAWLNGSTQDAAEAQKMLESAVAGLEKSLAARGVIISREGKTLEEYAAALRAAAMQTGGFRKATDEQVLSLSVAKTRLEEAKRAYDETFAAMQKNQASANDLAAAQMRLNQAQKDFNKSVDASGLSFVKVRAAYQQATAELAEAQRQLEEIRKTNDTSVEGSLKLAKAHEAVRDATNKQAKALEVVRQSAKALGIDTAEYTRAVVQETGAVKASKEEKARLKQEMKDQSYWFKVFSADATRKFQHWVQLTDAAGRNRAALEKVHSTLQQLDEAVAKMNRGTLPEMSKQLKAVLDAQSDAEVELRKLSDAYKHLGIDVTNALGTTADEAYEAYQRIERSGTATPTQIQRAWVKYLEVEKQVVLESGRAWSQKDEEMLQRAKTTLDAMTGATRDGLKNQETLWQTFSKQVSTIISDMGKDFVDAFKQLFDTSGNKKLEEEARELRDNLAERSQEWRKYAADVQARLAELESGSSQQLQVDLEELASNLAQRRMEYNDYVSRVEDNIVKIRETTRKTLEQEEADLRKSLESRQKDYQRYLEDRERDEQRMREDFDEALDDERKRINDNIEDKRKDYERERQDIQNRIEKLRTADAKANAQEIRELKNKLNEKTADFNEYVRRQQDAYAEFVDDHRRALERETEDLRIELERRKQDEAQYRNDLITKMNDKVRAAREAEEQQIADLRDALNTKRLELEQYTLDVSAKELELRNTYAEQRAAETAALKAEFEERKAEYDKFVTDVQSRLGEIEKEHRSVLDRVKTMFADVFASAGEALLRFVGEAVMGKLTKSIIDLLDGPLKKLGNALSGIFGGATSTAGAAVPDVLSKVGVGSAPGIGSALGASSTSGAGGVAGALGGIAGTINLVSGIAGAIGSVGSFIMGMRQEGTLNAVEHNTRYGSIYTLTLVDLANRFLPWLENTGQMMWDHVMPALAEIITAVNDRPDKMMYWQHVLPGLGGIIAAVNAIALGPSIAGEIGVAISAALAERPLLDAASAALLMGAAATMGDRLGGASVAAEPPVVNHNYYITFESVTGVTQNLVDDIGEKVVQSIRRADTRRRF